MNLIVPDDQWFSLFKTRDGFYTSMIDILFYNKRSFQFNCNVRNTKWMENIQMTTQFEQKCRTNQLNWWNSSTGRAWWKWTFQHWEIRRGKINNWIQLANDWIQSGATTMPLNWKTYKQQWDNTRFYFIWYSELQILFGKLIKADCRCWWVNRNTCFQAASKQIKP